MKINKTLILTTYLTMLFLIPGCTTTTYEGRSYDRRSSGDSLMGVASLLRFEDVPVPSGFKIIENESFAFQNDATRVALLKYAGARHADLSVQFYKEQMPIYKWSPINIIEYERRILNYEKGSESCIVTIEAQGKKSIVTIAISPKSRPMKVESGK